MIKMKNSAKAIIVDNNQVLLLKKKQPNGKFSFTLPGGTQELGESLDKAVVREVFEETSAEVNALGLAYVYEHSRPSRSNPEITKYKIEFAFVCELIKPYRPQNGHHPDPGQLAVEWVAISDLKSLHLEPQKLEQVIPNATSVPLTAYLGNEV